MITEQQIMQALHRLPPNHWQAVLNFIEVLNSNCQATPAMTARQLLDSELIGLWEERTDIPDSLSYARRLREQVQDRSKNL
jgi:hypothetical protein